MRGQQGDRARLGMARGEQEREPDPDGCRRERAAREESDLRRATQRRRIGEGDRVHDTTVRSTSATSAESASGSGAGSDHASSLAAPASRRSRASSSRASRPSARRRSGAGRAFTSRSPQERELDLVLVGGGRRTSTASEGEPLPRRETDTGRGEQGSKKVERARKRARRDQVARWRRQRIVAEGGVRHREVGRRDAAGHVQRGPARGPAQRDAAPRLHLHRHRRRRDRDRADAGRACLAEASGRHADGDDG